MSLRLRFLVSLGLALAISLALGAALAGWHAARSVRTELTQALEVADQTVRAGVDALPDAADPAHELAHLVSAFDGDRHVQAALIDPAGTVRAQSRLLTPAAPAPRWFAAPITPSLAAATIQAGPATLRLRADPANEAAEIWGALRDTASALGLFCGLATLAIMVMLGRALRPITGLRAGLVRIGAGDYGARVPEAGPPEIATLARGFNRMAARLAEAQAQNARLQEQLLTLQDEERAELSRELHDEIGPALFAASMTAASLTELAPQQAQAILEGVAHVQRHVRDLLRRLRPLRAVEFGLAPAIGELVAFWRSRHPGIAFSAEVVADEAGLAEGVKETVYRIVQEGLSNAVRHGRPSRVEVAVAGEAGGTLVRIADDGSGPGAVVRSGFGLAGMRERVAALGGTLSAGAADRGWTVLARLPS